MREPFDVNAYIESLGPMTPEQRALVNDGMSRVTAQKGHDDAGFLRDAALYLSTLALVGDVTAFDDDTWRLIETMRRKHGGDGD